MTVTGSSSGNRAWLLLLFFLPSTQAHARVQAWRRLQRIGAVSLKNSAYALPESSESREDFEWIKNEIVTSGGQAMVLVAHAPEPAVGEEIISTFRAVRAKDFEALAVEATKLLKRAAGKDSATARRQLTQGVRRLRERFDETVRRDFFGTPEREPVATALSTLDQRLGRTRTMPFTQSASVKVTDYRGKTWVTRPRPGVDRMSSAWLIRRFIDPNAQFVFGEPAKQPKAIPFDTFEADFGHHGTLCTFETLCERFAIAHSAVRYIGRVVHDLDLKENTYGEAEAATIGRLVEGLRRAQHDDDVLLRSGIDMFEALYQSTATSPAAAPSTTRKRSPQRTPVKTARRRAKRS